jgi:transposase
MQRFPRVPDCVSYCRLGKCAQEAAGKRYGTSGAKLGKASLQWAFSEAAVVFLRTNPAGQKSLARWEKKPGKGKAWTVLCNDGCTASRMHKSTEAFTRSLPPGLDIRSGSV